MTVRDIMSSMKGGAIVRVQCGDKAIAVFETKYWDTIAASVLDLEVREFLPAGWADGAPGIVLQTITDRMAYVRNLYELNEAMCAPGVSSIALAADIDAYDEEEGYDEEDALLLTDSSTKFLNLNGHIIRGRTGDDANSCAAIHVKAGTLWIYGDGFVYGGAGSHDNVAVWADGETAEIGILGGIYDVGRDAGAELNATIYASGGAHIEIMGGLFLNEGLEKGVLDHAVLNVQNGSGSSIVCKGGTFIGQNPKAGDDEDRESGYTFLADDSICREYVDNVYVVEPKKEGQTV